MTTLESTPVTTTSTTATNPPPSTLASTLSAPPPRRIARPTVIASNMLPPRGVATIKSVLSGDTVILLGSAASPNSIPKVVTFTLERITSPRMASKNNNHQDEPGAFAAREWLRELVIGKQVAFETRQKGPTASDRVYGILHFPSPENDGTQINLSVEAVRLGHATPKFLTGIHHANDDKGASDEANNGANDDTAIDDPTAEYDQALQTAHSQAVKDKVGIHSSHPTPLCRSIRNAGDDFQVLELVEKSRKLCSTSSGTTATPSASSSNAGIVQCVIEHVFDGSRLRLHVVDPDLAPANLQYSSFTLILAGVACPRAANIRLDPPTPSEPFAEEAKHFVEVRLLHRKLGVELYGTDRGGLCAVGCIHHPRGNIGVELLRRGLARVSDWSSRLMDTRDVPAFRVAENNAKRSNLGVWVGYAPPALSGASEVMGTVVEVITGDTVSILPSGVLYTSENVLKKVSIASVRAPRVGNERAGRSDEDFATECKERLRVLTVGKNVKVSIHYEREINFGAAPVGTVNANTNAPKNVNTEKRQFGTIAVGRRSDIGETLIQEGLATTQRHRDDEEKSPRYDDLVAAEAIAKATKKGVHSEKIYKKKVVNDLANPVKAKSYAGSLTRAGTMRAVVEYVFNGSRFKVLVPSENCHIVFALEALKSPQPSPNHNASTTSRPVEPFGDAAKRHARLTILQRTVEISCTGVTMGGVITGKMFVGGGEQRRDFTLEMVGSGLATVDQRKIDYGEAPRYLIEAQDRAKENRVGIWSLVQDNVQIESKPKMKSREEMATITISEIRSGNHFFFRVAGDETADLVDESMRVFTAKNGTAGSPCDIRVGKYVAALFDDGKGKSWYRARIHAKLAGKVRVLFIDHGNVAIVPVSTHLRPLEGSLSVDNVPAVVKEAVLAFTNTRGIEDDDGLEAAKFLQYVTSGSGMTTRIFCKDGEGKLVVALYESGEVSKTINEQIVAEGLARAPKSSDVTTLMDKMLDGTNLKQLSEDLLIAEQSSKKLRRGMWRYGDIGDDDVED